MINKIIFDYGGVFTQGSRAAYVAQALGATAEQQASLRAFLASGFIKQAAKGEWSAEQVVDRICELLHGTGPEQVLLALDEACRPDPQMLQLLERLKARYPVFLISDSLPPYSAYINKNLGHLFNGLFLSDQLGERKSGQLYERAQTLQPGLFEGSVYIDDRAANLPPAQALGAIGVLFTTPQALLADLRSLGVEA